MAFIASLLMSSQAVVAKPIETTGLVVIAVDLLEEGLGVVGLSGAGDAGDQQQSNKGGCDGLHGYLLLCYRGIAANERIWRFPLQGGVVGLLHGLIEVAVT